MNYDLIQVQNEKIVTTSLLVAEKFNKQHKNVIQKIESLLNTLEIGLKLSQSKLFEKCEYNDTYGRPQIMYYIDRDGFSLLVMGFTGSEALNWKLRYIEAFNAMEKKLREPQLIDKRIEVANLLISAPDNRVNAIKELYPEYFTPQLQSYTLERYSDVNTTYSKWKEDYNITKEWITTFPTIEIFNSYKQYCTDHFYRHTMGKKQFYATLEWDFQLTRSQKSDGYRYFLTA